MILQEIENELKHNSDAETQAGGQRFFKEEIRLYGVKTATVKKISKEYFKRIKGKSKAEIFDLCEALWQSGTLEESFIACNWSYNVRNQYEPGDFLLFEQWVGSYITNWASCDTFCNHTMGAFLHRYPDYVDELKNWTRSENRWMRRASAVSLIVPAREGQFLEQCLSIALLLMKDEDDLVQKGYGWLLKVACKHNEDVIYEFVMKHKAVMPRTALRYAIEKMPAERRKKVMEK